MSYGLTVDVLQEVLPLDHVLAASSIRRQVSTLGRRLEAEQATDARQQAELAASVRSPDTPEPSRVRAVGIDGGYADLGPDYFNRHDVNKTIRRVLKRLADLGCQVDPMPHTV